MKDDKDEGREDETFRIPFSVHSFFMIMGGAFKKAIYDEKSNEWIVTRRDYACATDT